MVRATLAGRKTVTRSPMSLPEFHRSDTPGYDWTWRGRAPIKSVAQQRRYPTGCWQDVRTDALLKLCPFGVPGDRLWVREVWLPHEFDDGADIATYRADYPDGKIPKEVQDCRESRGRWKSGKIMPRAASRITIVVKSVSVERLHAIDDADALREGVRPGDCSTARWEFAALWDKINGKRAPWSENPWVWRVAFSME